MAKSTFPQARPQKDWVWHLGNLMHDVSRIRRTVFDQYVKPLGLTRSQWSVLACLCRHDGMTQTDLAEQLELGKAATGGLLDRLEGGGLIERRSDSSDRRSKGAYTSSRGKLLNTEMSHLTPEMSERILEGLDHLLSTVKHNLSAMGRRSDQSPVASLEQPIFRSESRKAIRLGAVAEKAF